MAEWDSKGKHQASNFKLHLSLGRKMGSYEKLKTEMLKIEWSDGRSDIEGKVARVAARMEPRGRERHRWANRKVEMGGSA